MDFFTLCYPLVLLVVSSEPVWVRFYLNEYPLMGIFFGQNSTILRIFREMSCTFFFNPRVLTNIILDFRAKKTRSGLSNICGVMALATGIGSYHMEKDRQKKLNSITLEYRRNCFSRSFWSMLPPR